MACETNTGYVLSPAEILSHEADHARDSNTNPKHAENSKYGNDPQYDSKEERRVITGSEQRVAKKLGKYVPKEGTRTDHYGENVRVSDPTSSDIEEPQH